MPLRAPHTLSPDPCAPSAASTASRDGSGPGRACPGSPCGAPWTTTVDASCRLLLPKTATSTRVSSISLLRPRVACTTHAVPGEPGVSRHLARRSEPVRLRGRHFLLRSRAYEPTSGRPCRALHPGSRPPRGGSGCQPALADDTRGESRDRFHRRSVKTDSFPDPGRLPSWSTLRGSSAVRVTLPSPHGFSPFLSSPRRIARSETSGHAGRGCPLARRFVRSGRRSTTSAIRNTTRGHTANRSTPAIGNALGHPRRRSSRLGDVRRVRAGGYERLLPRPHPDRAPSSEGDTAEAGR